MSLVKMDLRTRYRRSILGLGWSLLHPMAMTAILWIIFRHVFQVDSEKYAASLMAGLAFWNYLTTVTQMGCQCFFQAESYIRQYPSPLAIFPLRTALGAAIHFLLALLLAMALAGYLLGFPGPLALLSLLPTLALLFVFGWAMALLAGITNVLFQDTEHLTTVAFQILFYGTPIIYTEDVLHLHHRLETLMQFNPLVYFLKLLRDPIIDHQLPTWDTYALAGATVAGVAALAIFLLSKLQRRFVFYL
jgi:ABC-type polysaccharide/polyol phosphate export permease